MMFHKKVWFSPSYRVKGQRERLDCLLRTHVGLDIDVLRWLNTGTVDWHTFH